MDANPKKQQGGLLVSILTCFGSAGLCLFIANGEGFHGTLGIASAGSSALSAAIGLGLLVLWSSRRSRT